MFKTHRTLKIIGLTFPVLVMVGIIGFLVFAPSVLLTFNPADVPLITANPVQLDQIFAVSLFRSGIGHDYSFSSWDGETCRSMKHYFNWGRNDINGQAIRSLPTANHPNIQVYAPFDGRITGNYQDSMSLGTQVHIAAAKNPAYFVRLFHIDLLPTLHVGSRVKSGQLVGNIGPKDGMDVSYEAQLFPGKEVFLSIFDYMTPQAFAPYAAKGFKPGDFILTRAQADAKNYQCNGETFTKGDQIEGQSTPATEFAGYVKLGPAPKEQL
ncbi:hypothetical protein M1403_03690 [Patescibacteria group bacterium]|nr:hypothetical protein [Patescibacteria group bacterium]